MTATNAQPQQSASPRKCVLIVEDDDDARDVLGELISALGHDVIPAATALEALERAQDSKLDFALIDLSLGGADGCEVARQIRGTAQGQSVRLVALTGYSDRSKRKQADDAGFDDFIVKPAHMNVIEALLNARAERASAG